MSRESSCDGRNKYLTLELAKRKAKEKTREYGFKQTPYKCAHCGTYHLTNMSREEVRKKQQEERPENTGGW